MRKQKEKKPESVRVHPKTKTQLIFISLAPTSGKETSRRTGPGNSTKGGKEEGGVEHPAPLCINRGKAGRVQPR